MRLTGRETPSTNCSRIVCCLCVADRVLAVVQGERTESHFADLASAPDQVLRSAVRPWQDCWVVHFECDHRQGCCVFMGKIIGLLAWNVITSKVTVITGKIIGLLAWNEITSKVTV